MGFQIGASVGVDEEGDAVENGVGWGDFLRVRIKLDLSKPFPKGRMLKLKTSQFGLLSNTKKYLNFVSSVVLSDMESRDV